MTLLMPSLTWGGCRTNPSKLWICRNSPAWDDGYLIPTTTADLCASNAEQVKLIPALRATRDQAIEQRDTALKAVDGLKLSLADQQRVIGVLAQDRSRLGLKISSLEQDLANRTPRWQVVILVGGGLVLGGITGWVAGRVLQ